MCGIESEAALQEALDKTGREWQLLPGEGAFYGPKIEFALKDCMGREQQCGTIQVDFSMPGRLGAHLLPKITVAIRQSCYIEQFLVLLSVLSGF